MTTRPVIPRARGFAALAALLLAACGPREPEYWALVGATVIPGDGSAPLPDQVILIRGTLIDEVAPREGFKFPKDTRQVDVTGRWVMPGLIDAHAHVATWALPRFLAFGVTSVRDLHGLKDSTLAWARRSWKANFAGPRIYSVGAMLDTPPLTCGDAIPVPTPDSGRRAVDHLTLAGADQFKVYTHITPSVLGAIVDEAAAFGLGVAAHLGLTDAVTASRIGVRTIEHLSGVPEATLANPAPLYEAHRASFFGGWTAFETSWASLDSTALARTAERLASHRVILVPTLVLHDVLSRLDDSTGYHRFALSFVPDSEKARWDVQGMIARAGWKATNYAAFRASRPKQDLFLREFRRAGGRIATGTDAGHQLIVPGYSLHEELELLVRAGLTPLEAITAATANGAAALDADSLGAVAAGKVADLVILSKDPVADIRNTRQVEQVVVRGRLLAADSLRSVR
ncbi:MAG: amidohydrolase family protein [Gemmatimonadota bacterium]